jgi:hypothetical protein
LKHVVSIRSRIDFQHACRMSDLLSLFKFNKYWLNDGLKGAYEGECYDIVELMIEKGANECINCRRPITEH